MHKPTLNEDTQICILQSGLLFMQKQLLFECIQKHNISIVRETFQATLGNISSWEILELRLARNAVVIL